MAILLKRVEFIEHPAQVRFKSFAIKVFVFLFLVISNFSVASTAEFPIRDIQLIEQDGLLVKLYESENNVYLDWQFYKKIPSPIDKLTVSFNGRAMVVNEIAMYPLQDAKTYILAILDVTGIDRRSDITSQKARIARLFAQKKEHTNLGLSVYSNDLFLFENGVDLNPLDGLLKTQPSAEMPNLGQTLLKAVKILKLAANDSRNSIFLFTDGYSEEEINVDKILKTAEENGTIINVIFRPSARNSNDRILKRIANKTNGIFVSGNDTLPFLVDAFRFIDSGGHTTIDTLRLVKYPWDKESKLKVTFSYGDKQLVLGKVVNAKIATIEDIWKYIRLQFGEVILKGLALVGWILALSFLTVLLKIRKHEKPKSAAQSEIDTVPKDTGQDVSAALHRFPREIDDTESIIFTLGEMNVGRGPDMDWVIDDPTVSRHHFSVKHIKDDLFEVQNKSTSNPILINGEEIDRAILRFGDLVIIGNLKFKFDLA